MRTLLAHPLRAVGAVLLACAVIPLVAAADLPQSIGPISDYGAVFDRHDREEISASIEEVRQLLHLDVSLLVSWENPFSDVATFAEAVFRSWGLGTKDAILAVFLRSGRTWTAAVVASSSVRARIGAIDRTLAERIHDLVSHSRIEEAARAMLAALRALPAARAATEVRPPAAARSRTGKVLGLVAGIAAGVAFLAWCIHRWVCPRCGRLLRATTTPFRSSRSGRVYSCRRCGFRRQR